MNAKAEIDPRLAEAIANEIYSSQLMRRFRDTLANVRDGLEDEGDRIYFGSTNDADQLREIIDEVEELEWDRILASSQKQPDLYAQLRNLNQELRALRETHKGTLEALQLAANRLARCVVDHVPNSREFFERSEWADEAQAAMTVAKVTP